jgi:hypothetical protein
MLTLHIHPVVQLRTNQFFSTEVIIVSCIVHTTVCASWRKKMSGSKKIGPLTHTTLLCSVGSWISGSERPPSFHGHWHKINLTLTRRTTTYHDIITATLAMKFFTNAFLLLAASSSYANTGK